MGLSSRCDWCGEVLTVEPTVGWPTAGTIQVVTKLKAELVSFGGRDGES